MPVRDELELLLNNITTQVWYLKDVETYGLVNDAHADFLDAEKSDLINKKLRELLSEDEAQVCIEGNRQVFEEKRIVNTQEWVRSGRGEMRLLDITKSPKLAPDGSVEFVVCSAQDITDKKEMEQELQNSRQQYREIVDTQQEMICRFLPDTTLTFVNAAYARNIGITKEAENTLKWIKLVPDQECDAVWSNIRQVINRRRPVTYEHQVQRGESYRWQRWTDYPITDENGAVREIQSVGYDITELKTEQQKMESIFRAATNISFIITEPSEDKKDAVITEFSPGAERIFGYEKNEVLGRSVSILHTTGDVENFPQIIASAQQKGSWAKQVTLERKNGETFPALFTIYPFRDIETDKSLTLGVSVDITELEEAKNALQRSEKRYRGLVESQNDLIVRVDPDNRLTYVNGAYCRTFGKSREELIGAEFTPLIHEDDRAPTLEAMEGLKVPPHRIQVEQRAMTVNGWRWIFWEDNAVVDDSGNIVEVQGVGRDITDIKEGERALRESEAKLSSILHNMTDVVWSTTWPGLQFLFMSPSAKNIYGRDVKQFMENSALWEDVIYPDDREIIESQLGELERNGTATAEYRIVRPGGAVRWIRDQCRLIRDENDKPVRVDGTIADITSRKEAERALDYRNRLQRLIARIASDFVGINDANKDEIIDRALCEMSKFLGADRAYVAFLSPDTETAAVSHEWSAKGMKPRQGLFCAVPFKKLRWSEKMLVGDGQCVTISSRANLPPQASWETEYMQNAGIESIAAAPIVQNGRTAGILTFESNAPQIRWDESYSAELQMLGTVLANADAKLSSEAEKKQLRKQLEKSYRFEDIVSKSDKMRDIFTILPNIAQTDTTVLLEGESGTGKELFARAIHNRSGRKDKPLITVNCGALPEKLIESELFGYKSGAFTDAKKDKPGDFTLAEGGTIFLDEIGELPLSVQVKLLRVLEGKTYKPVGGTAGVEADVRIITATNTPLSQLVEKGRFRQDLFYRVNVMRLELPPLRERRGDVPLLIRHFITHFKAVFDKDITGISRDAEAALVRHDYPGNVRELENIIEHSFVLCDDGIIQMGHLPVNLRPQDTPAGTPTGRGGTLEEMERTAIARALQDNSGNKAATARQLGIATSTLFRKLKTLDIAPTQEP